MKLQQAMMALYKKEGVNPMSGCLPIIPQIFIFFALYKVLFVTIEMRQMPFMVGFKTYLKKILQVYLIYLVCYLMMYRLF